MFLECYNLGFFFFSINIEHFSIENYFLFRHIDKIVFNIEKYISFDNFVLPQTLEDLENKRFRYNINEKSSKQINNLLDNIERFIKSNTENVYKEFYIQIDGYICCYNGIKFLPMKNFILKNQVRFAYLRYYLHSLYYYARIPELREYINIKEFENFYDLLTPKHSLYPHKLVEIDSFIENYNKQFFLDCTRLKETLEDQNEPTKILPVFLECFRLILRLFDLSHLYIDKLILFGQYKTIEIYSKTGKISGIIIGDFMYFSLSKNLDYNIPFIKHLPYIYEVAKRGLYDRILFIRGTFDINICFYDAFIVKSKSKNEYFLLHSHEWILHFESMIIEPYQFSNILKGAISFKHCVLNKSKYLKDEFTCLDSGNNTHFRSCEINIPLKISNFESLSFEKCKFMKDIILEFLFEKSGNFSLKRCEFIIDFNGLKIQSLNSIGEDDKIKPSCIFCDKKKLDILNSKCNGLFVHNKFKFENIEFRKCNFSFKMIFDLQKASSLLFHSCIGKLSLRFNDFNYDFGDIEFKQNSIFKIKKIDDHYKFEFKNLDFKKSNKDFFENNQNCFLEQSNTQ